MTVDDFLQWLGRAEQSLPPNTLRDMELSFKIVNRDPFIVIGARLQGETVEMY